MNRNLAAAPAVTADGRCYNIAVGEALPFDGAEDYRETVRRLYGAWLDRLETALRATGVAEGQRGDIMDAMRGEAR